MTPIFSAECTIGMVWNICLLFTVSPISTYSAKYTWHLNKVIIIIIIIIIISSENQLKL